MQIFSSGNKKSSKDSTKMFNLYKRKNMKNSKEMRNDFSERKKNCETKTQEKFATWKCNKPQMIFQVFIVKREENWRRKVENKERKWGWKFVKRITENPSEISTEKKGFKQS